MTEPPAVPLPRYGEASLADLVPSLFAALGAPGFTDVLDIGADGERPTSVALLLVDGLGSTLVAEHAAVAPYLSLLAAGARTLTTGFPSSTAPSIASLGTGRPPGGHGLVGYRMVTPRGTALLHSLRWTIDEGEPQDPPVPETLQPAPTVFETAAGAVSSWVVAPSYQKESGLTRAVLRGSRFATAMALGDLVAKTATALATPGTFVYAYHGDLDLLGHVYGPGSPAWLGQLAAADRLVEALATALPPGALLAVTGDHGMVPVSERSRVDLDARPDLTDGVVLVGGEPRARYLYTRPGAAADVLAAWQAALGDRMWVVAREQAVDEGWFGPGVTDAARHAIGDVVAAAYGDVAVVRPAAEPLETRLAGHHGSFTDAERLVPLLLARAGA